MLLLTFERVIGTFILHRNPTVSSINFVNGNDKWDLLHQQQPNGFFGLFLDTSIHVYNQDSYITKVCTSSSEVTERLVAWSINKENTWDIDFQRIKVFDLHSFPK